ncbi:MAG: BatA domain-containing protein [Vicinamibacterales bacterium]|jgi:hypothetical protein|nr:hypothetical protein [Acidobacteriota bacterium]MDP7671681.1 BatA domain-containing protein [Vicinamibacterales bacterium]HJO39170.1 BatA domain-containing protein [Vicinamibacterales bacterium]
MFGVSFLVPAFLVGLAAAAIPIVLHLLKRETAVRRAFAAVFLIKRTPVEQAARRRLREWILLALRVTALVLLALAFARPYLVDTTAQFGGVTVVALDRSFSMSSAGQFARARELAREAVNAAPAGDAVAVVAFDETATVVVQPSAGRPAALTAIEGVSAGAGATRYRVGLSRAAEVIGTRAGRIVIVTDLQRSGWGAEGQGVVPDRIPVTAVTVGSPAGNLAVTAVSGGPSGPRATILNGGDGSRLAQLTLLVDGVEVDRASVTVPAGVSAEVDFPVVLPRRGEASVVVEDDAGYPADNARYLLLAPPEPLEVAVVTAAGDAAAEAFFLHQALQVADAQGRLAIEPVAASRLAARLAEPGAAPAVVLVLTSRGLDRRGVAALDEFARAGGGVLLVAGPDLEPIMLGGLGGVGQPAPAAGDAAADRQLVPAGGRHPIFQALGERVGNLAQVRYARTRAIEPTDETRVLAWFSDGAAALVEQDLDSGRLLVFGSDLDDAWNDFPRHPMFVPFVHEMLRYLGGDRRARRELLVGDGPAARVEETGFMTLADGVSVAVNVNRAESDPTRMSVAQFDAAVAQARGAMAVSTSDAEGEQERDQGYWRYGLGLMALAFAAESLLGSRMG